MRSDIPREQVLAERERRKAARRAHKRRGWECGQEALAELRKRYPDMAFMFQPEER